MSNVALAVQARSLIRAMDLLLSQVIPQSELREEIRVPLFKPVTLHSLDERSQTVEALTRDISPAGIGLVHQDDVPPGNYEIVIPMEQEDDLRLHLEITWCRVAGPQWYMSGGRFFGVAESFHRDNS